MNELLAQYAAGCVRGGGYRLTVHAEAERENDAISIAELEYALGSERLELLENYQDDPRGASGLFLGFTDVGQPIHAVVGLSNPNLIVVITVYRPDPELWYNWLGRILQ